MIQTNTFLIAFTALYVAQTLFYVWMERLNLKHVEKCGARVPAPFRDVVDSEKSDRINAYTKAKGRLGVLEEVLSQSILLGLLLCGFMTALDEFLSIRQIHYIPAGILFFLAPGLILFLLELPFGYYHAFVIEERFGFNRTTPKLWLIDQLKSGLLSIVILSILLSLLLAAMELSERCWWLLGFAVVSTVQLLLAVLYPIAIAPLFNRFEPVRDELLSKKIRSLLEENGMTVEKILQMDAGIRSRHTNAYFTGLGRTKRVVLYDTLLESHTHGEILSVLAHELGHLKKRHILKQFLIFGASMLGAFYLTYRIMSLPVLYSTFGFNPDHSYAGLFLVGILWRKAGFFLQPLYMAISRRFEREADRFALGLLKSPSPMVAALKRLAADNLSNLTPHPLYVWFNYSHPTLTERIAELETVFPNAGGGDRPSMGDRESASC